MELNLTTRNLKSTEAENHSPMQFPLIDILRAIAALLVLVFHAVALGEWQVFSEPRWGLPFRQGWIGVDLFFCNQRFCNYPERCSGTREKPA